MVVTTATTWVTYIVATGSGSSQMETWVLIVVLVVYNHHLHHDVISKERTYTNEYIHESECRADIKRYKKIPLKHHARAYFWCRKWNNEDVE
jgi:hypothetical protein